MSDVLYSLLGLYGFWFGYLACAGLYRAWPTLPLVVKCLSVPGVLAFLSFDVAFHFTVASLVFWDRPRDGCWTTTQRLSLYRHETGWRRSVAYFICHYLLDPFQQGGHCH